MGTSVMRNNSGKLRLEKGTQIFNAERDRWAGAPKALAAAGTANVQVRRAATMRHNPKLAGTSNEFSGNTVTNTVNVALAYANTAPASASREKIGLAGISVPITANTKLTANEIVFVADPAADQPAIIFDPIYTIPADSDIVTFKVYFGVNPTGTAMADAANYVLPSSGFPTPFNIADLEMTFGSVDTTNSPNNYFIPATISVKTGETVVLTATDTSVNVAARVDVGGTLASPAIPDAAFWSATANRTILRPAATVANVAISGEKDDPITAQDVVITLTGSTFLPIAADANVDAWFANMPNNLQARVKTAVAVAGVRTITVTISGTPIAAADNTAMVIEIPAASLENVTNGVLVVTANPNAKWDIEDD
jgi:plastocyanin